MPAYNSQYTGLQVDAALAAVYTAMGNNGIVDNDTFTTTLGSYLLSATAASTYLTKTDAVNMYQPTIITGTTGQFYRGDKSWSNVLNGRFRVTNADGTRGDIEAYRGDITVWLGIGTGNENHGVYSEKKGDWIVYSDASGIVTLNGNAATATQLLSAGTTAQFYRGDRTWSNSLANYIFNTTDVPEGAANLNTTTAAHCMTFYRNGICIPYQMDNANDGGIIRCLGQSESDCIFEFGTWDDSGGGETIRFSYYPTTSQITPTYSVTVPKASGTIALVSSSSRKVKENIMPMTDQEAKKLYDLNVVSFDYIKEYMGWKNQFGMIAEDVYEKIPFCVHIPGDDPDKVIWGIDYAKLVPYLIKLAQIQEEEIKMLQLRITNLEGGR